MQITRHDVSIVSTSGSAGTMYIKPIVSGFLHQLRYLIGTITSTVLTITLEDSGVAILTTGAITANTTWYPRAGTHDAADATTLIHATVGNGAGSDADATPIAVAGERIKIVLSSATASRVGTLYAWIVT